MIETNIPRPEYPRPDFRRDDFLCLNGSWEFAFDDADAGLRERWYDKRPLDREITVPFVYQSERSGVHDKGFHNVVWYKKRLRLPSPAEGKRSLLHFGAADYEAQVWVNAQYLGNHSGGNTPFAFDITDALTDGETVITVRVRDDAMDLELPRGKQYWKPESHGIFYTPSTGLWQSVWIEQVSENRLDRVWVTPDVDNKTFALRMEFCGRAEKQVRVRLSLKGKTFADDVISVRNNRAERLIWLDQRVSLDWNHQETLVWTPKRPVLFDLSFEVLVDDECADRVESYCALRKVSVADGKFMLNNRPFTQKMLLDQGYWPETLMTAPTDQAFIDDILACKAMGFNGVRKHQKAEDPRYLYHADRLGLLVWGECSSAYVYSRTYAMRMVKEWTEIVERDYNHPCIVCWVPLNESWGVDGIMNNPAEQSHATSLYHLTKSLDQTRLVISNDGWNHTFSDLLTIHDYADKGETLEKRYADLKTVLASTPGNRTLFAQGHSYSGQPILVSEFGGIAYRKGRTDGWGYSEATSDEDFLSRYRSLVTALLSSPLVQGFVYTQLCDVEQEINGLMTYDRRFKLPPERIREINLQDECCTDEEEDDE